jgi:hypothetical protein
VPAAKSDWKEQRKTRSVLLNTCLRPSMQVGEQAGKWFNCDALRQRACRFKQRKIDMRSRLCFDGLYMPCCIEAMSYLDKTVKDLVEIKT